MSNRLTRAHITIALTSFLISLSGTANCAESSPFSPTFILKQGQVLSTTVISIGDTKATASFSTGQATSSKLRYSGATETLLIGLPSNIELGAALSYSSIISKSPSSLQTTEGFIDPSYFINKTWLADSPAYRAKAGFSYTPHAGSHGSPNSPTRYTIGGSITKFMGDNWIGSIGLSRNIYDRDKYYDRTTAYGDSTSLSFGLSKEVGAYLISTGLSANYVDKKSIAFPDAYAESKDNRSYSGSITVSRAVSDNFWLGITYINAWNTSKFMSVNNGFESSGDSDGRSNILQATLKAVF